jgi:hypothetical protein
MKSGYQKRTITVRSLYADGTDVTDGPAVNSTYPIGSFKEDYEYISHPSQPDYLDVHNGRFCVTPEYPNGIYAYFCTVDANHNSAYPYIVGPTYYGNKTAAKVTTVTEATSTYTLTNNEFSIDEASIKIFPNPASQLIAIQVNGLVENTIAIDLIDINGKLIKSTLINTGQSIAYFDVQDIYDGTYIIKFTSGNTSKSNQVIIKK